MCYKSWVRPIKTAFWSQIQHLSLARYAHRSVVHNRSIYHIGGKNIENSNLPFEEWKFNEEFGNFTITVSETELSNFYNYPETFVVNFEDFENCITK